MTPEEIAAALALCDAATDGPWEVHTTAVAEPVIVRGGEGRGTGYPWGVVARMSHSQEDYGFADAAFIAAARTGWPEALHAIQRVLALNPADLDAADDHYLIGYGEETRCSCGRWTFYPDETEYDLHRAEVVRDRIRSAITGGTDEG